MGDRWMQTYSGRKFWPLQPSASDVCIDDVAHALGMLCRFGGHTHKFYSVAEHSVLVSYAVPDSDALHGLLHDATEAYVQDVVRPFKHQLPMYVSVEKAVWREIAIHFSIGSTIPESVKQADTRILINERDVFFPNNQHRWSVDDLDPVALPGNMQPVGLLPEHATELFYRRFQELCVTDQVSIE